MPDVKGSVFLILTIAIIIFGARFISNTFKTLETKTTQAVDATELLNAPTRDNPLTLTPSNELDMLEREKENLLVAHLNPTQEPQYCLLVFWDNQQPIEPDSWILYNNEISPLIEPDRITTWKAVVQPKAAQKGTKVLQTQLCCSPNKDENNQIFCDKEYKKDLLITVT